PVTDSPGGRGSVGLGAARLRDDPGRRGGAAPRAVAAFIWARLFVVGRDRRARPRRIVRTITGPNPSIRRIAVHGTFRHAAGSAGSELWPTPDGVVFADADVDHRSSRQRCPLSRAQRLAALSLADHPDRRGSAAADRIDRRTAL